MRPESIILFEKVFFASLALGVVNTALSWNQVDAMLADPALQASGIGAGTVAVSLALGILLPLLLWYFIARRASTVAKWIFVVLTAMGLFGFLSSLADPAAPRGVLTITAGLAVGLQVYAAWLLFKPDATAWLAGQGPQGPGGPITPG